MNKASDNTDNDGSRTNGEFGMLQLFGQPNKKIVQEKFIYRTAIAKEALSHFNQQTGLIFYEGTKGILTVGAHY